MGTYTTNKNLFMPTVGETGWGTLVNGNFATIDTTMKGLSNRITAVENEVNGNLSCTSITTSGKITANGGIAATTGTFSGAVTGENLSKYGFIPYILFLATDDDKIPFSHGGFSVTGSSISSNRYQNFNLATYGNSNGAVSAGTHYSFCRYSTNTMFGYINDIKVIDGSWSYKLTTTNVLKTTVTTNTGLSKTATKGSVNISQSEALSFLSNPVKIVNTLEGSQHSSSTQTISIDVYNTGSVVSVFYCIPSILYNKYRF